ncbi:hypothetical protein M707_26825, partial [Arthrobacter sp. AK-YN10]
MRRKHWKFLAGTVLSAGLAAAPLTAVPALAADDPAAPGSPVVVSEAYLLQPESGTKTIAEIQGTGPASPLVGSTVTTRGKVTAAYATGGLNGYYV